MGALATIENKVKDDMRKSLLTVQQTTLAALNIWANDQRSKLNNIAADPRVSRLVVDQLGHHLRDQELIATRQQVQLRRLFAEFQQRSGQIGFFVIAPDGTNIASSRDSNVGQPNLIQHYRPDLFDRALGGEIVLIPPIPSDVTIIGAASIAGLDRPPTMFFAAPVRDDSGRVVAVMTERFDPHGDFSRVTHLGRIGESGETYTFDRQGSLLSDSRFIDHLQSVGIIKPGEQSILSVQIRDPGGNPLEGFSNPLPRDQQPLTRMAASAVRGERGTDTDGYRDYRGIEVIGAWEWDDTLGIGITSEIDAAEAMEAYYSARFALIAILAITVSVSTGFTGLSMVLGSRANSALRQARDRLEQRVDERTQELQRALGDLAASEERFELAMRATSDGIWDWNYISGDVLLLDTLVRHARILAAAISRHAGNLAKADSSR